MRRWGGALSLPSPGAWTAGLLCAAAMLSPAAAARGDALPVLSHHGPWLTDAQGRVAILHGVQIDRFAPGTPNEGWIDVPPEGVRFIGAQGFNVARVSIGYAGVEPQPGRFDDGYLDQFLAFDGQLAGAGVYDLVDMMQGQYSAEVGGGGFPDWMAITDGAPNVPRPFPQGYLVNPAEERAWDNFWSNSPASDGVGLQDHYVRGMQRLARAFESQPAFLGFDLLNEPWPGSQWPSCANPAGCPVFDQSLNAFYRRLIPALRRDDPRHLVFYEPHALFDEGAATNIGSIGDPNAVFTFHNYCLGDQPGLPQADPGQNCGIEEEMVLANAEAQARPNGDGLLEDEWGNTPSVPLLVRMAAEADEHMIGWSYWAYEDCCKSPGAIVYDGAKAPTDKGNLNLPVLKALVRPYPKLIAGTPSPWTYDATSGVFELRYSTRGVAGAAFPSGADTEVELPALQYPTGYSLRVDGADVVSAPDANLLRLANLAGAHTVELTVAPAQHHPRGSELPGDCPANTSLAILVGGRADARVIRVAIHVNGQRVTKVRGRRLRRIALPPGLADGSSIQLFARRSDGRLVKISREVRDCRLL